MVEQARASVKTTKLIRLLRSFNLRPEEIIAAVAFVLVLILSAIFHRTVSLTPYIFVMFVLFAPTFLIPIIVLNHRSSLQTLKNILTILRDWVPVLMCMVLYENLHDMVYLLNPGLYDEYLLRIDQFLFGVQPTIWMERFIRPWLTEYFYFAYMTFFFYPVITLGTLYYQRRLSEFRHLTLLIVATLYLGFCGYLLVPAVGPQYILAEQYHTDLHGYALSAVQRNIDALFRMPRDCFPSLHFALSSVILFFTFRRLPILFWIYLPLVVSLWISTVYLRYHYVIDLIAGLLLVFLVYYLCKPRKTGKARNIEKLLFTGKEMEERNI